MTSPELRADCARCVGLCCVALSFTRSADFAFDKAAGQPCHHLRADFGCAIHERLRADGMAGCTSYDCFGAGQRITQGGMGARLELLPVVRQLHELLWYLADALERPAAAPMQGALSAAFASVDALAGGPADMVLSCDLAAVRAEVNPLLLAVSELVRGDIVGRANLRGADLSGSTRRGRGLRGADLVGADLRGAYLIGTDLRAADLRRADLIGADLRGARLDGADLRDALFLTQGQLDSALGDRATRLLPAVLRPTHWV